MVEKTRGRPALEGERYPSGRLKRRPGAVDYRSETQIQRLREGALGASMKTLAASITGAMLLRGDLTPKQFSTIEYVRGVFAAYERHAGKGTARRMRSPSYEPSTNRAERLDEDEDTQEAAETANTEYTSLRAVLDIFPNHLIDTFETLAIDDHAVMSWTLPAIEQVLNIIENHREGRYRTTPLKRAGPLRPRLSREERFEKGEFATPKAKARPLTSAELEAAARDRAETERKLLEVSERCEANRARELCFDEPS